MEKELPQSDIPVKRKIQKTIRKYHISGNITKKSATNFFWIGNANMRGGGQRPFGTFPKIHPFWKPDTSLTSS